MQRTKQKRMSRAQLRLTPIQAEVLRIMDEEILDKKEHWCKGWFAKGPEGELLLTAWSEEALRFCISGAYTRAVRKIQLNGGPIAPYFWHRIAINYGLSSVYNDAPRTTFASLKRRLKAVRKRVVIVLDSDQIRISR